MKRVGIGGVFGAAIPVVIGLTLASCGHSPSKTEESPAGRSLGAILEEDTEERITVDSFEVDSSESFQGLSQSASKALSEIVDSTRKRAESAKPAAAESPDESRVEGLAPIPVVTNKHVEKWIHYFTARDRDRFQRFLTRGAAYREVVQEILRQNGVPQELYYLAMIESGYSTHAHSHASAVGVWQFIRGTGRRYGLETNYYIDERRDPIRATEAAAKYLTDLYNVFQDWYLAFAAYNAGEGRVMNAIMAGKSRDYWELLEDRKLPTETANYVPKFLAAMIIGENPERFGFDVRVEDEPYPNLVAVELPSPVHLKDVATFSGVPLSELKDVNPHIRRGITSPNGGTYEIWVPEARVAEVEAAKPKLALNRVRGLRASDYAAADETDGRKYYKVRSGENLSSIARKFRMSVSTLKRLNGMSSDRLMAGMRLRVSAKEYHRNVASSGSRGGSGGGAVTRYRVRRGDNLVTIARRFNTTVEEIKELNKLRRSTIYVGQKLKVAENI